MLKSNLCDYSDAYTPVKGTKSVTPVSQPGASPNNNNK